MKLLFDQNLSFKLCKHLADLFPGSDQVRLLGLAQADDLTVWHRAKADGFTLVSQDADFADLAGLFGPPPKVIWLRSGNQRTASIAGTLRSRAEAITAFGDDPDAACLESIDVRPSFGEVVGSHPRPGIGNLPARRTARTRGDQGPSHANFRIRRSHALLRPAKPGDHGDLFHGGARPSLPARGDRPEEG